MIGEDGQGLMMTTIT